MPSLSNMNSSIICLSLLFFVFVNASEANTLGDAICQFVDCGHGVCNGTANLAPFVTCECSPGWTPLKIGGNIALPSCIVPTNCTLNFSCGMPQLPPMIFPPNITNPCNLFWCGDGTCEAKDGGGLKCNCNAGAFNLQNQTNMPCFHQCNLGKDCPGLSLGPGLPPLFTSPPVTLVAPPPPMIVSPQPSPSTSSASSSYKKGSRLMVGAVPFIVFLMRLQFAT